MLNILELKTWIKNMILSIRGKKQMGNWMVYGPLIIIVDNKIIIISAR